jgi:hypothetical protein
VCDIDAFLTGGGRCRGRGPVELVVLEPRRVLGAVRVLSPESSGNGCPHIGPLRQRSLREAAGTSVLSVHGVLWVLASGVTTLPGWSAWVGLPLHVPIRFPDPRTDPSPPPVFLGQIPALHPAPAPVEWGGRARRGRVHDLRTSGGSRRVVGDGSGSSRRCARFGRIDC